MTRTLLAVPTGRRVGLTSTCLGLVTALDRAGVEVGFVKPIAQPRRAGPSGDGSAALVRALTRLRPPDPVPADQAARLLGAGRQDELMERVVALAEPQTGSDVLVVEGLVPSPEHVWSTRVDSVLAGALDADVLLVADGSAADPAALAESVAIAAAPYRSGELRRVVGCVASRVSGDPAAIADALRRHDIPLVGAVPFRPEATWPRVDDVADALGARTLVAGDGSRRVSEVLVCAQAVPGLLRLLRDGALLLVPGDRHDVVMAACLAAMNGVRLAGLLLTAGVEPHPDVLALTSAAEGLPILVVDELTYPTAVRLHDLDPELSTDDLDRARQVGAAVADALDPEWLQSLAGSGRRRRLTPAAFRHRLVETARRADARIVLPEGAEPRTVRAAVVCAERGIARPLLLTDPAALDATLRSTGLTLPDDVDVVDPATVADHYVDRLVALRAHKGMTPAMAQERLGDPITVGTMMLAAGEVDGLVAGAVHTTAATVRPALELIRVAPGARLVSSVFFMLLRDEVVVYGDCAINPDPTAEELADIAVQSAESAAAVGVEPRIAMISFSTGASGAGADVEKVAAATALVRERRPDLAVDGPLQYDAAAVGSIGHSKRPGSPVAGRATVFVFPDLNTGNTTYKAVQRSADVVSIGPMLQGLARPVNDLSRGAEVEDIVYTIALTAIQSRATQP
ncbi:phosphate acetyltransferase [Pseudonocardia humida]|uniref:Phosphate acetyltransferase n=1 Tax=Pseudonocardia humida TaxID=2800819 RepID=A0ABT0ZUX7_9PSEU|nr:phosphate acetyltransferase [Pseudonocardia humida]MCO1654500.1 phosphate acetyltransferase [Pseudonocardia humida]